MDYVSGAAAVSCGNLKKAGETDGCLLGEMYHILGTSAPVDPHDTNRVQRCISGTLGNKVQLQ